MRELAIFIKLDKERNNATYKEVDYLNYLTTRKERKERIERIQKEYPNNDIYIFSNMKIFQRG